jgi:hypothetical protein
MDNEEIIKKFVDEIAKLKRKLQETKEHLKIYSTSK